MNPGEGYRLLVEGDRIPQGYEWQTPNGDWLSGASRIGLIWSAKQFEPMREPLKAPRSPEIPDTLDGANDANKEFENMVLRERREYKERAEKAEAELAALRGEPCEPSTSLSPSPSQGLAKPREWDLEGNEDQDVEPFYCWGPALKPNERIRVQEILPSGVQGESPKEAEELQKWKDEAAATFDQIMEDVDGGTWVTFHDVVEAVRNFMGQGESHPAPPGSFDAFCGRNKGKALDFSRPEGQGESKPPVEEEWNEPFEQAVALVNGLREQLEKGSRIRNCAAYSIPWLRNIAGHLDRLRLSLYENSVGGKTQDSRPGVSAENVAPEDPKEPRPARSINLRAKYDEYKEMRMSVTRIFPDGSEVDFVFPIGHSTGKEMAYRINHFEGPGETGEGRSHGLG